MSRIVNKNNRYLPVSIGVEVESCRPMMEELGRTLHKFLPSGNAESSRIFECQTVPVNTSNPLEVVLLGEVVRRCIPNYVKGGNDGASASAHCHLVGFNYGMEVEHIEALMIGLMPFLSLAWNRNCYPKYTFRAVVTGQGSGYSRFTTAKLAGIGHQDYSDRGTWLRNQSTRHKKPSEEIRTNENSPLWVYFITPMLNNQGIIDKLDTICNGDTMATAYNKVKSRDADFHIFNDVIEEIKGIIIPFLIDSIPDIVKNFKESEVEYMTAILNTYLVEDEDEYNKLVNGLIDGDKGLKKFFKVIATEQEKVSNTFNVIEKDKI